MCWKGWCNIIIMENELPVRFKILYVDKHRDDPSIIVRQVQPGKHFSLIGKPALNNVLIKPFITSVRANNENGEPCHHTYAFYPIIKKDIDKFKIDTVVDLST